MNDRAQRDKSPGGTWSWSLGILAALAAIVLAYFSAQPPYPESPNASDSNFSAIQAETAWHALMPSPLPHPLGSPENASIRDRIQSQLSAIGLNPTVLAATGCTNTYMVCGHVYDIIAVLPGKTEGSVLLTAHYDSVPASPGVGDDLSGVAALLEMARVLHKQPQAQKTIIFLFTDGEEEGLLGASAFQQHSPLAKQVDVAFNIDSRLMRSPCLMYETGRANLDLIKAFAHSPHPSGASWMSWVYEHMSNDTDFSIFLQNELRGLNFACLGPLNLYHTPRDTFGMQNLGALQQVGGNLLSTVAHAADNSPSQSRYSTKDAVYTDIAHRWVLWWPAGWSWALTLLTLLPVTLVLMGWRRRRGVDAFDLEWGFIGIVLIITVPAAVSWKLSDILVRIHSVTDWWAAHPLPALLLWVALPWLTGAAIAATIGRRSSAFALFITNTWIWSVASLAAAIMAPALCIHLLLPVLAAMPAALWLMVSDRPPSALFYLPPAFVACFLIAGDYFNAAMALSPGAGLPLSALAALAMTWLAPFYATVWRRAPLRRTEHLLALLACLMTFTGVLALPAYDRNAPQRLNLLYLQRSGDSQGALMMGKFEGALERGKALNCNATAATRAICLSLAQPFTRPSTVLRPWLGHHDNYAALVSAGDAPPPQLKVIGSRQSGKIRTVTLQLSSLRSADGIWLLLPKSAHALSVSIDGQTMDWANAAATVRGNYDRFGIANPGNGIHSITLKLGQTGTVNATLLDIRYALPQGLEPIERSLPESAVPLQFGNAWMITTQASF